MSTLLALSLAFADEPEVVVTDSGTVRGSVTVAAAPDQVQALVEDPDRMATAVGGGLQVSHTPDGDCLQVTTRAPHPVMAVEYTVRSCPTDRGLQSTLVHSDDLSRFAAAWTVEAIEGGSRVTYDLDVQPKVPLPGFVVRRSTRRGVRDALTAIQRVFAP